MKSARILVCLAAMALPCLAQADPSPFCGKAGAPDWPRVRDAMTGTWIIEHQSGYARAGQMVLPFPGAGDADKLDIVLRGDTLQATHPQAQAPLVLRPSDEPRWEVDASAGYVPAPVLSPDDVGLIMGCDQMELPRITGTSTAVVDGVRMDFTYRLMVADRDTLYGIMEMNSVVRGMPMVARRTVWLRKAGA